MNRFQVGFAAVNINPPLGIGVSGYYVPRFAKGILDDLEVSATVLACNEKQIALISVDACGVDTVLVERYTAAIERATGIPAQNIFLSATHTYGWLTPPYRCICRR